MKQLLITIAAVVLVGCGPSMSIHEAASNGNIEVVKQHLDAGVDVNAYDDEGITPLSYAAIKGHKNIVELLIGNGADVNAVSSRGLPPIMFAKNQPEIKRLLIKNGAKRINGKADYDLRMAAFYGRLEQAKQAIDNGANVDSKNELSGETPLHRAARGKYYEIVKLLISNDADVNAMSPNGSTPLHYAVNSASKELGQIANEISKQSTNNNISGKQIVELLIAGGADLRIKNNNGMTALDLADGQIEDLLRKHSGIPLSIHGAARSGNIEAVKQQLIDGEDVNVKDKNDRTALHWAKTKNIAKLLISKGADVNFKCVDGDTPLRLAALYGHTEVAELLVAKGANVNIKDDSGSSLLHFGAKNNRPRLVELLLKAGADVYAKDTYGRTPVHNAAASANKEILKLFITKDVDLNVKDEGSRTALDYAIINNKTNTAALLRKYNAKHGTIHSAAFVGEVEAVKEFLTAGIDVNAKDDVNIQTPLHRAAGQGHNEIVELLIAKGADVNATNKYGSTPLHRAAGQGRKGISELLIVEGADMNSKDEREYTPLHYAASEGHKVIAELLIANGADINPKNDNDKTPLDRAMLNHINADLVRKRTETATLLRKHGGMTSKELSSTPQKGNKPNKIAIEEAVLVGNVEALKEYLINDSEVNFSDKDGWTLLHFAAYGGHNEIIELLIEKGANLNEESIKGKTPIDLAKGNIKKDTAELLRKHGAKTGAELKAEGK